MRPYVLVAPLILDLALWLGYQLSMKPLTDLMIRWLNTAPNADASAIDQLDKIGSSSNLFMLLTVSMPSTMTRLGSGIIGSGATHAQTILPTWILIPAILGLLIGGIALGMAYLTLLGNIAHGGSISIRQFVPTSVMNALKFIGFILIGIGVMLLLLFPLILISGVLLAFGISIIPVTSALLFLGMMWAFVLLYFAQDAIVISNAGPARAMYMSYNLVRAYFWSCLGLIVVSMVIQIGTPLALKVFTRSTWGMPLAFLVRAYVLTGLALAALIFYRDRASAIRVPKADTRAADHTS
ncbi:MAG: hypothetical protein WBW04_19630 [Nitrolancea sp.]